MGIPVLILGESGSGKSTSLRNFSPNDALIINVASKPLPFRQKLNTINTYQYGVIGKILNERTHKRYIIDDSQYLLAFELFDKAKVTGYGKFTDIAVNFKRMLDFIIQVLPADTIVYLLHHCETGANGKLKAKTVGKMLDDQLTLEGLFSIVLYAEKSNGNYVFKTVSDGTNTCKTPMGMFNAEEIDNDLMFVDTTIREYWGLQ